MFYLRTISCFLKLAHNWKVIFFTLTFSISIKLTAQETVFFTSKDLINYQNQYSLLYNPKILSSKKKIYYEFTNIRPAFNAFRGEDSYLLRTSMNGFGSLSEWNLVLGFPFAIGEKKIKFLILPRTGFLWKKFRFANPLIPQLDTFLNKTIFQMNTNPNKDFGKGFFSYGKTKLVLSTFRINPELGIAIDFNEQAIGITAGPVMDILISSKYKQKFIENTQKKKVIIKDNNLLNINFIQYGISAAIMSPWIDIYGAYFFSPFFKANHGPNVKAFELGFACSIIIL